VYVANFHQMYLDLGIEKDYRAIW